MKRRQAVVHRPGAALRRAIAMLGLVLPLFAGAAASDVGTRFVAIAFHDIVDRSSELGDDALTTDRLVAFFEWLRGNGWSAITLDDVERARRGERPLPAKPVLITFDDGHRSLYTRVYPLLLAYRMPAVAALVGEWVEGAAGSTVRYGSRDVPREHFISWEQAREMQRSGLVEFALHSHALHREVAGNPQGNTMPAASTRRYAAPGGYESAAGFAQRVRDDLSRGRALLQRELGRAPRALAWPYGRYNASGVREAQALGFTHLLTLDTGLADARRPLAINRYLPTHNPSLPELVANLEPDPNELQVTRLTCLDPAALWSGDAALDDERLGRTIERLRALGVTGVVVDAAQRDAQQRVVAAWFPNRELPLAGDVLSRIAWQLQTRAGVSVYARLPHRAAADAVNGDPARFARLYEDLGAMVPLSGWVLEGVDAAAAPRVFDDPPPRFGDASRTQRGWADWVLAERRAAHVERLRSAPGSDAWAWQAFASIHGARPRARLLWLAGAPAQHRTVTPHPLADASLVPTSLDASAIVPAVERSVLPWFTGAQPIEAQRLVPAALAHERNGGVALGWCPDDPLGDRPSAATAAPGVSAATFPLRR